MIDSVCLLSVVCYSILCLRFSLLLPVSCVIVFFHGFIVGMNFLFSWGGGGGGWGGFYCRGRWNLEEVTKWHLN